MRTMPAGKFKAHCLKVMDSVLATREPVVITKRGRPVAKLVPVEAPDDQIFGRLKGQVEIVGDILEPLVSPDEWEANRLFFSARTSWSG